MKYKAVLFDLDGTLLDTLDDITDSMNSVLSKDSFPLHTKEVFETFVGDGEAKLVERALPEGKKDAESVEKYLKLYREVYNENCTVKTAPFPGIPELISELRKQGVKLTVLSNKLHSLTNKTITHYFNPSDFTLIWGKQDAYPKKPDPASAKAQISELNISPEEFLYLGDSEIDMQTAKGAGMFAVGATWGFRPESVLRDHGADLIVHKPEEVLKVIHGD